MKTYASGIPGNLDIRLEPDSYCPRIFINRPAKFKLSLKIHDPYAGTYYQRILGSEESIYIEDIYFDLVHRDGLSIQEKLHAINKTRILMDKLEGFINEKLEEIEWRKNNPYVGE
jgi:hypothetical protein